LKKSEFLAQATKSNNAFHMNMTGADLETCEWMLARIICGCSIEQSGELIAFLDAPVVTEKQEEVYKFYI